MAYLNPFLHLGIDPSRADSTDHSSWIKQEKKELLAEFELQDSAVIELNGHELDKATVLQLFEELEDETLRALHLTMLKQASLLLFLEEASLDYFYDGDVSLLGAQSLAFRKFIAPHFSAQFNRRLFHAYRQKDWEEIDVMCAHPLLIPHTYHAACYQETYRQLHTQIQEIETLTEEINAGKEPGGNIQEVCDDLLLTALNQLPEYFQSLRDKYSLALENLALAVHNQHRRVKLAVYIIRQGLKLNIGKDASHRLNYVLEQLKDMVPADSFLDSIMGESENSEKTWTWLAISGIAAGAWLLFKFLR